MLEVIANASFGLQHGSVLTEVAKRLKVGNKDKALQEAILTYFHDLMRSGQIAWGRDLMNYGPPSFHVTERGRRTLEHLSRDPMNPDGYMHYLRQVASIDPIAWSYIEEALQTYANNCYKATAIMVGGAVERLLLDLRDVMVARLKGAGHTNKKLNSWKVKEVFDAVMQELKARKKQMPNALAESFEYNWPSFMQQIRAGRNEVGHPSSIDPVTPEVVHGTLLIFPELAKLILQLKSWVAKNYP
jgi:hypothetical protein